MDIRRTRVDKDEEMFLWRIKCETSDDILLVNTVIGMNNKDGVVLYLIGVVALGV